jgi:hypothetical protein
MQISKRKTFFFALALIICSTILCLGGVFALDLYLHHKFAKAAGLNWRGYRGPVLSKKQDDELRIAVVGGSTVLGYGVHYEESFPAQLQEKLNQRLKGSGSPFFVSVANLGFNSQGAYGSRFTLEDYASLNYDLVIVYDGYNDYVNYPAWSLGRRDSALFRLTGYYLILPTILYEKAIYLRGGYNPDLAVYRPNPIQETQAKVLTATADVATQVEKYLSHLPEDKKRKEEQLISEEEALKTGCVKGWSFFCRNVEDTVEYALGQNKKVLVVGIPQKTEGQIAQGKELEAFMSRRYSNSSDVKWKSLAHAVDLRDTTLAFDGCHLTRGGNEIVANELLDPTLEILKSLRPLPKRLAE